MLETTCKKNELTNALASIKWGTNYLMKAHPHPNILYGEIGDPDSDHQCWQRPEDMSPRNSYRIDEQKICLQNANSCDTSMVLFCVISLLYANYLLLLHMALIFFLFIWYFYLLESNSLRRCL